MRIPGAHDSFAVLDELLPNARFRTQHSLAIQAPADEVLRAFEQLTVSDLRLAMALFAVRLLPGRLLGRRRPRPSSNVTAREFFLAAGFTELRTIDTGSSVFGFVGQPWRLDTRSATRRDVGADDFVAFAEPGYVKAVTGVLVRPVNASGTTSVLMTQTRVIATSPAAERRFRPYWLAVEPFSGVVRMDMLRAVRRRVLRGQP